MSNWHEFGDGPHHPASPHRPSAWVGDWSSRRAALSPDRIGLVDATTGERFTYADLDRRANRVARLLREHDVESSESDDADIGGRVAVLSRNRPEVVDLFFATGKTGGVLAPLSHRLAPPELRALLEQVEPELLVVETPFVETVETALESSNPNPSILELPAGSDSDREPFVGAIPEDDSPVEPASLSMDDAHLLLHTGGSTGTPKETVVTHGSVVWNSLNTITAWGLRSDDVSPLTFPLFHTGGWNVISVPLWHMGGTVVIAREVDPGSILSTIEHESATVLIAVPAVLRAMIEHDTWDRTDLSTLRFGKSGGGPCRDAVIDAWWDRGVDLSQGYGLTECGPNNFAMPDNWSREKADSVGLAAMHVDTRVVDSDGEPVTQGEVGELQLAGPHAADRYWQNPEESADAFGGGWLSTGDLARIDADGYYYIVGRTKDMFVSGGENVYPAEVEDVIAAHPAVAEVVVVPVADEQWGQIGRAVVELAADAERDALDIELLRTFLDGRLARYKHPRSVAFVESMPTSGPSKLDREAISERFGE